MSDAMSDALDYDVPPRTYTQAELDAAVASAMAQQREADAALIERLVFTLECCDSHQEYQNAQVLKPVSHKIRNSPLASPLAQDWLERHDEALQKKFVAECQRFHDEGNRCATCSRLDKDEIAHQLSLARLDEAKKWNLPPNKQDPIAHKHHNAFYPWCEECVTERLAELERAAQPKKGKP